MRAVCRHDRGAGTRRAHVGDLDVGGSCGTRERDRPHAGDVVVTNGPSTSTVFVVSFPGALFAILTSLLLAYDDQEKVA